jgi:CheY-like chemotaxis protein
MAKEEQPPPAPLQLQPLQPQHSGEDAPPPRMHVDSTESAAAHDLPPSRPLLDSWQGLLHDASHSPPACLPTQNPTPSPLGGAAPRSPRILIAEDGAVNRRLVIGLLARLGVKASNLVLAVDGVDAVEKAKQECDASQPPSSDTAAGASESGAAATPPLDLILMDIQMPRMSGIEASKAILAMYAAAGRPPPKIVAMTANVLEEERALYREAGMAELLAKPFRLDDLKLILAPLRRMS